MSRLRLSQFLSRCFLALLCVLTGVAAFCLVFYAFFWTATTEEQLFGHKTTYFYGEPTVPPLADYGLVFSVGHNAGSSLETTREAIANGADVIEIDVASMNNTLVSAHVSPPAVVGSIVFRGPTLESVWRAAEGASVIQLDLKESTPAFRKRVVSFLARHAGEHTVMVATTDEVMLRLLEEQAPDVLRFLSVADGGRLWSLYNDADLVDLIDGVTIRYQLVSADSVSRLKDLDLIVLAWTVNDLTTVNGFVALGVDGISTNNLAIMDLLGGLESGEHLAQYRMSSKAAPPDGKEIDPPVSEEALVPPDAVAAK